MGKTEVEILNNEMCLCGHSKLVHTNTCGGLAKGHGTCIKCDCDKFTWLKFKEDPKPLYKKLEQENRIVKLEFPVSPDKRKGEKP